LSTLVDETMVAMSAMAGVVGVAEAPATAGEGGRLVDSRLLAVRSDDGSAEDGEGAQIGGGGGWEEVKLPSRAN
jgi:hypothetical protein